MMEQSKDKASAPKLYKWVKASDELPEFNKAENGRVNGRPAVVKTLSLIEGYITANGNLERVENVEWLKEVQSSAPLDKD